MKLSELIRQLQQFQTVGGIDDDPKVEIAVSERSDEWYDVFDIVYEANFKGDFVIVINTD